MGNVVLAIATVAIIVAVVLPGGFWLLWPRKINWGGIEHFPDVEPAADPEQRYRNEGRI